MTAQRGRKRGPYKPRVPKTAQDAAKAAAIDPTTLAMAHAILGPSQSAGDDVTAGGDPRPGSPLIAAVAGDEPTDWQKAASELQQAHTPPIRFVRYRYGWGYMETAPAILCDSLTLAVLLPHDAKPAAACKFQFRAPAGGWSFTHAQEGADPGQYTEV